MRLDALVGFSINLEQSWLITENWRSRKPLAKASTFVPAGTSFNVAKAMNLAGLVVKLIGTVGKDHLAGTLEQLITVEQFEALFLPMRQATPMTISLIVPEDQAAEGHPRQKLLRCKPDFSNSSHDWLHAENVISGQLDLNRPRCVVATGVRPFDIPLVESLFAKSGVEETYRVLAPSMELLTERPPVFFELLSNCDLLALNNFEAAALLQVSEFNGFEHRKRLSEFAPEVLVTCNSHGAWFLCREPFSELHQESFETGEVVDDSGAGDCFLGYFLSCKDDLHDISHCLRLGAAAAALKIQRLGGSDIPTINEVETFLASQEVSTT